MRPGAAELGWPRRRIGGTYGRPVDELQRTVAVESVIDRSNTSAPHKNNDAKIVEVVENGRAAGAVVVQGMVSSGEKETDGNAHEVYREDSEIKNRRGLRGQVVSTVEIGHKR